MRSGSSTRDRRTAASETEPTTASPWRRLGKHLLTAAGILAFTYGVLRVLGPRDDVPVQSIEEVRAGATIRNRTDVTVPDDITTISIDGPKSEESETDLDVESASETDDDGSDEPGA